MSSDKPISEFESLNTLFQHSAIHPALEGRSPFQHGIISWNKALHTYALQTPSVSPLDKPSVPSQFVLTIKLPTLCRHHSLDCINLPLNIFFLFLRQFSLVSCPVLNLTFHSHHDFLHTIPNVLGQ